MHASAALRTESAEAVTSMPMPMVRVRLRMEQELTIAGNDCDLVLSGHVVVVDEGEGRFYAPATDI